MDKDNIFCTSKFHIDTNDVLHIFMKDLVGTLPTIVLYNEDAYEEDVYPPPVVYTTINYGYLYNWYTITDVRNIAPVGWHVPTKTEFETLSAFLGGDSVSGGKLKETGITHWLTPNTGATNEHGFNARGGGVRADDTGVFASLQISSDYWSTTTSNVFEMYNHLAEANIFSTFPAYGLSLRLIKDSGSDIGYVIGNDGKIYHTVTIGAQIWMADNSAETKFRNGDTITEIVGNPAWVAAGIAGTEARCVYNNDIGFM